MAMKQVDQVRYDALAAMINTLSGLGHDYDTVYKAVKPQIKEFEDATGRAVRIKSNFEIELIDRRKDFLRIRNPNEQSKTLRTKVDGVSIDVKIYKEGDYEFENATIAQSLRRLADEVSALPKELAEFPECEVAEHVESLGTGEQQESGLGLGQEVSSPKEKDSDSFVYKSDKPLEARFSEDDSDEEDHEGHHEGGGFSFGGTLDNPLGDDRVTDADEIYNS